MSHLQSAKNNHQKGIIMNTKKALLSLLTVSTLAFGLAACEKEGPAERAGKQIDNATETAGEKIQEAGQDIQHAADDAKKN